MHPSTILLNCNDIELLILERKHNIPKFPVTIVGTHLILIWYLKIYIQ